MVMVACLSCSCFQMNGQDQMAVMVVMADTSYFKVNFCLAHSASLPEGLHVLLALIFFNDHSENNYIMIYWTDCQAPSYYWS